eukprot:TRINITY_DN70263_c0_g1_i1.p1 TRINITY_DN70263_c0_g1~~TRINITY_DN70263_c0_g1_i1.p1  ORF type:complete len:308 (-),score=64.58 TRINITY_DN70263_c0_g1_i1:37-861(-)
MPALLEIDIADDEEIVIVGDIHGQLFDLMNIIDLIGEPAKRCKYIFNGDFVDRGAWGIECLMILLGYLVAYPGTVWLLRGNHEEESVNATYGFRTEVLNKYNEETYQAIQGVFKWLPVAAVLNKSIAIMHGGIGTGDFRLEDIRDLERHNATAYDGVISHLLWSDPQEEDGCTDNPRGISVMWGPDVTKQFLKNNSLDLIIRSHECIMEGYTDCHDHSVITVFSAPNYCDVQMNLGAVVVLSGANILQPEYKLFEAVPHPEADEFLIGQLLQSF